MAAKIGEMAWLDLSIKNAEQVKKFYQDVIGWKAEATSMGDYNDYTMMTSSGTAVGGVCHATGVNSDLPPAWLPYFLVEDIALSVAQVIENGGDVVTEIKTMGDDKYAVIKDPAGAACAIYQKA
jgi:predicted enzyme related to lactoylglutathione lyase